MSTTKRQLRNARIIFYLMVVAYAVNVVVRRWIADWETPPGGWVSYMTQVFIALGTAMVAGFAGRDVLNAKAKRKVERG